MTTAAEAVERFIVGCEEQMVGDSLRSLKQELRRLAAQVDIANAAAERVQREERERAAGIVEGLKSDCDRSPDIGGDEVWVICGWLDRAAAAIRGGGA